MAMPMLMAQSKNPAEARREALLEYQARRRQAMQEYQENYRKAAAEYMRKRWEAFNVQSPDAMPERKEPIAPVVKQPTSVTPPSERKMPTEEVVDMRKPTPTPTPSPTPAAPKPEVKPQPQKPVAPAKPAPAAPAPEKRPTTPSKPAPEKKPAEPAKPTPAKPAEPTVSKPATDTSRPMKFNFYGTPCSVSLTSANVIRLTSTQEGAVATAWEQITSGAFDKVVEECRQIKEQLCLNDWGYYTLAQTIADNFCGKSSNESILLQSFLMSEGGYKMRLARGDNRLCLLLAVEEKLFSRSYFNIDGDKFYLLDRTMKASSYNICNFAIPGERRLSMVMHSLPNLDYHAGKAITRKDNKTGISLSVTPNANLTAYMNNYPPCSWEVYAATQLSERTAASLLPTLRSAIEGKSEQEAVGILLSLLHNAFPYKTDPQQFGSERTLFAEEMFAYMYSDCEDRSILFVRLVKELLGLDCILLHYPEHIASAVKFTTATSGDYIELGKSRYVVCDATYIGAKVGESMPEYRNVSAKIIRID